MSFRLFIYTILFSGLIAGLSGCEIINPEEETPSYIRINSIDFEPGTFGANSPKIEDAWVYLNGMHIGTFQLPATVPVLASGSQNITIRPGIYSDGIKQLRFPYKFYTEFRQQVDLVPGQVQTISPVVSYHPDTKYPFTINENFSDNSLDLQVPAGSAYKLLVSEDPVLQFPDSEGKVGIVYGKIDTLQKIIIESDFYGRLPQGGADIYLEMNYKSTLNLNVGVEVTTFGQTIKVQDLVLFASPNWNKVYVNLRDEVSGINNPNATFRVFIASEIPRGNGLDFVAVDNVRLIHF